MQIVNRWKYAFIITIVLLLLSNAFLIYHLIDAGVTISYMQDGYKDTIEAKTTLSVLVKELAQDFTREDVVYLLRKNNPDAFITDNEEGVAINQLRFYFEDDILKQVK